MSTKEGLHCIAADLQHIELSLDSMETKALGAGGESVYST